MSERKFHYMNAAAVDKIEEQCADLDKAGLPAWADSVRILIDNLRLEREAHAEALAALMTAPGDSNN